VSVGWYFLLAAAGLDLLLPFLLAPFYPGYSHRRQVMSVLGSPESPVRWVYRVWLVVLGLLLCAATPDLWAAFGNRSPVLTGLLIAVLCVFALGAGVLAGLFSVNADKAVETAASRIHGVGSVLGFLALAFAPLLVALLAFRDGAGGAGVFSLICFALDVCCFTLFVMADKEAWRGTRLAQEGYRGSLTLGIMRDTFEPKLPTLYQRFRTAYPHVSLLIRGYSHSSLLSALERGEVDAILNYMPMPSGQESPSILLHKNHQCIITALDHPLASRGSIRMEEVKDEPFVVMARTASIPGHDFIWKTAADAGFAPHVVAEATHVPVLLTLVSCGIGISTLSDDMACLCQGKVAFIPLLGVPFANVRLMWNEDNQNPALPHLLDVFRSIC